MAFLGISACGRYFASRVASGWALVILNSLGFSTVQLIFFWTLSLSWVSAFSLDHWTLFWALDFALGFGLLLGLCLWLWTFHWTLSWALDFVLGIGLFIGLCVGLWTFHWTLS